VQPLSTILLVAVWVLALAGVAVCSFWRNDVVVGGGGAAAGDGGASASAASAAAGGEAAYERAAAAAAAAGRASPPRPPQRGLRHRGASATAAVSTGARFALLEDSQDPPASRTARLTLYALAGWLGLVPFVTHNECLPAAAWALLGGGGVVFSLGIGLYARDYAQRPHSLHSAWYVLVVLAAGAQYVAIYAYAGHKTQGCLESAARAVSWW